MAKTALACAKLANLGLRWEQCNLHWHFIRCL